MRLGLIYALALICMLSAHSAELTKQKVSVTITVEGKNFLCQDTYNKLLTVSGTLQNDNTEYGIPNTVYFPDVQKPYCEIGHDTQHLQYITDYISTDNTHAYLNTLSLVQLINLYQNADYWSLDTPILDNLRIYIAEKLQNKDVLTTLLSTQENLDNFLNACNCQTKATLVHTLLPYIRSLFWSTVIQPHQILAGHTNFVLSVAVHTDGTLFSGSYDHTIRVWKKDSQGTYYCTQTLACHSEWISSVAVHIDGTLFSGFQDGTIRVWKKDPQGTYYCTQTLTINRLIETVAVHIDGTLFSGSIHETIRVWKKDTQDTYHCVQTLTDHTGWIRTVAVHTDGTLFSGSKDHTIRVWKKDPKGTYRCMQILTGHTIYVDTMTVHADGTLFSCGSDKIIRVWKPDAQGTYHCVQTLTGPKSINSVVAHNDGTLLSGSNDGTICVWKVPILPPLSLEQCLTVRYLYHQYQHNNKQQLAQVSRQAHNVYNTLPSSIKNIVIPWYNPTPLYKKLLVTSLAASIIGAGCYLYYKWFRK